MLLHCIMKIPRSSRDSTQLGLIVCLIVNDAYSGLVRLESRGRVSLCESRHRNKDDYEFAEIGLLMQWDAEERRGGGDR